MKCHLRTIDLLPPLICNFNSKVHPIKADTTCMQGFWCLGKRGQCPWAAWCPILLHHHHSGQLAIPSNRSKASQSLAAQQPNISLLHTCILHVLGLFDAAKFGTFQHQKVGTEVTSKSWLSPHSQLWLVCTHSVPTFTPPLRLNLSSDHSWKAYQPWSKPHKIICFTLVRYSQNCLTLSAYSKYNPTSHWWPSDFYLLQFTPESDLIHICFSISLRLVYLAPFQTFDSTAVAGKSSQRACHLKVQPECLERANQYRSRSTSGASVQKRVARPLLL